MELVNRITEVKVEPLAGDHIDDLKLAVKEFAKIFKCRVSFRQNTKQFVCDKEGNIAQIN